MKRQLKLVNRKDRHWVTNGSSEVSVMQVEIQRVPGLFWGIWFGSQDMKYQMVKRLNFCTLFSSHCLSSLFAFLKCVFFPPLAFPPHIIVPNPVLSFSLSLQLQALADEQVWVFLGCSSDSCPQLSSPCHEHVTVIHKAPVAHQLFAAQ